MTKRKRLFVIDGMAQLYRSHFAMINNPLTTSSGMVTSGIFGFFNSMVSLLKKEKPDYITTVFDTKAPTFRHKIYTEYKATREKMPDELADQIQPLYDALESMRMPLLLKPGFEADDIMGTLAIMAESRGWDTYLVTGDKDMMQLVTDRIFVYVPAQRRNPITIYDRQKVEEKFGVPPEKVIDYLGLMGDSSDNVPGIPGVGAKNATKLILEYGSLEEALAHADEVKNKRVREGLQTSKELGLLSKELVTIDCHVPIDVTLDDLIIDRLRPELAIEPLQALDINGMTEKLLALGGGGDLAKIAPPEPQHEKHYRTVTDEAALSELVKELKIAEWISFDLETTSLDAISAEIVGLCFSTKGHTGWYVPIQFPEKETLGGLELDRVLEVIGPILEDESRPKIGQHLKYDAQVMLNYGILIRGITFDTLIAAHLVDPDASGYKLENLSERHLGYTMKPIEDLIGKKGKDQKSMAEVPLEEIAFYGTEDADVVGLLYPKLRDAMIESELMPTLTDVEMPLIPVIMIMERNGVHLDLPFLERMSIDMGEKIEALVANIHAAAGTEFNVNSPQQLGTILFDMMGLPQVRKRSTDVTVLQMLKDKHELPGLVLDYRQVKKLKSTYIDVFPTLVNPKTGRIHSSFHQTVAATGRLSSTNPNFQNIPIRTEMGREIRRAFKPELPGWSIVSADYSQIELRIMAHLAQEHNLLNAFNNGLDIHAQTAAIINGIDAADVTDDMRRTAKVVNFGIMYGAGAFRMSQELDISISEGRELVNRYFNTYPGIRMFIDNLLDTARATGYVETIGGRKRKVPNLTSKNGQLRVAEERVAVNTPIQGTAAELIKKAMIAVHRRLVDEKFRSKMILQIHDELLFEAPDDEVERLIAMVVMEMESAMKLDVPLTVDTGVGPSWYEAH